MKIVLMSKLDRNELGFMIPNTATITTSARKIQSGLVEENSCARSRLSADGADVLEVTDESAVVGSCSGRVSWIELIAVAPPGKGRRSWPTPATRASRRLA